MDARRYIADWTAVNASLAPVTDEPACTRTRSARVRPCWVLQPPRWR